MTKKMTPADMQAKLDKAEADAMLARAKAEQKSADEQMVRATIAANGMRIEHDWETGTRTVTISGAGRRKGGLKR